MAITTINLKDKFDSFSDHWSPKVVGQLNGQMVKLAKLKGEFVMHHHEHEDELFLVQKGILKMEMEDTILTIHPGEFVIIPKGTPHKPIAEEEVEVILFEPASTLNTGNIINERTVDNLNQI